jgi:hypothetical protein
MIVLTIKHPGSLLNIQRYQITDEEAAQIESLIKRPETFTLNATITVPTTGAKERAMDLGSLALAIEELTDTWFQAETQVDITR